MRGWDRTRALPSFSVPLQGMVVTIHASRNGRDTCRATACGALARAGGRPSAAGLTARRVECRALADHDHRAGAPRLADLDRSGRTQVPIADPFRRVDAPAQGAG